MGKTTQKELAKKKSMAKLLVEAKGENFDDWMAEQYDRAVSENEATIQEALEFYKTKQRTSLQQIGGK